MIKNMMAPLWLMYPQIPKGSIGWRMGYGEDYEMKFSEWFHNLTKEEKEEFNSKFPEPICFTHFEFNILRYNDFWTYKWQKDNRPVYSIETMKKENAQGKKREKIFFWGHTSEGTIGSKCLSQWYMADFYVGHIKYCCMEQYMMSKKALLFGDKEINEQIMKSSKQGEIKSLGRKIRGFKEEIWSQFKRPIILTGNYYKFSQLENFRKFLLGTGDAMLIEASPYDRIWGIGMSAEEAEKCEIDKWKGQNLLGFALMEVRDELKRIWKYEDEIDFEELHSMNKGLKG